MWGLTVCEGGRGREVCAWSGGGACSVGGGVVWGWGAGIGVWMGGWGMSWFKVQFIYIELWMFVDLWGGIETVTTI